MGLITSLDEQETTETHQLYVFRRMTGCTPIHLNTSVDCDKTDFTKFRFSQDTLGIFVKYAHFSIQNKFYHISTTIYL